MDIKNGYDFDLAADRAKCWAAIEREKPTLVIGSPPCTLFSRLQELNKHMYKVSREWMVNFQDRMQQAKRYVKFCVDICNYQRSRGRFFLHEHPWLATSRGLDCVEKLMAQDDVRRVQTHMCKFGILSRIGGVGSELGPVLKPTGFMTNSVHIANELQRCVRGITPTYPLSVGRPRAPRFTHRDYVGLYSAGWPHRNKKIISAR